MRMPYLNNVNWVEQRISRHAVHIVSSSEFETTELQSILLTLFHVRPHYVVGIDHHHWVVTTELTAIVYKVCVFTSCVMSVSVCLLLPASINHAHVWTSPKLCLDLPLSALQDVSYFRFCEFRHFSHNGSYGAGDANKAYKFNTAHRRSTGPGAESDVYNLPCFLRVFCRDAGCYQCLVIEQRHDNILQYKQSQYRQDDALSRVTFPFLCTSFICKYRF